MSSQTMDDYLDSQGFFRKQIAKDGSCLFRIVSEHVYYSQAYHCNVREACIKYITSHESLFKPFIEGPFDEYIERLKNPKEWAGHIEMTALSLLYKRDFIVFQEVNRLPCRITDNNFHDCIMLCYSQGNHYDCVYPKRFLVGLAVCQSIVYESLYKDVFDLGKEVEDAVKMMLHDKAYSKQRKNNLNRLQRDRSLALIRNELENSTDNKEDGESEIRRALSLGVPPFPYKVAKALDPEIYRNVEFDLWNEARKEQIRNEQLILPELGPGVKCWVRLDKNQRHPFYGHVQELTSPEGPVTVFIEDIGEKRTVPYDSLEPMPIPLHKALMCSTKNGKFKGTIEGEFPLKMPVLTDKIKYKRRIPAKKIERVQGFQILFPKFQDSADVSLKPVLSNTISQPAVTVQTRNSNGSFTTKWPNYSNRTSSVEKRNVSNFLGGTYNLNGKADQSKNMNNYSTPQGNYLLQPGSPSAVFYLPGQSDQGYIMRDHSNGKSLAETTSVKVTNAKNGSTFTFGCTSTTPVITSINTTHANSSPLPMMSSDSSQYITNTPSQGYLPNNMTLLPSKSFYSDSYSIALAPYPFNQSSSTMTAMSSTSPSQTTGYENSLQNTSQSNCVPVPSYTSGVPLYPCYSAPDSSSRGTMTMNVNSPLKSQDPSGVDLPLTDLPMVRYFYNLGCDYYRMSSVTMAVPMTFPSYPSMWPNGTGGSVLVPAAGIPYSGSQLQHVGSDAMVEGQNQEVEYPNGSYAVASVIPFSQAPNHLMTPANGTPMVAVGSQSPYAASQLPLPAAMYISPPATYMPVTNSSQ